MIEKISSDIAINLLAHAQANECAEIPGIKSTSKSGKIFFISSIKYAPVEYKVESPITGKKIFFASFNSDSIFFNCSEIISLRFSEFLIIGKNILIIFLSCKC